MSKIEFENIKEFFDFVPMLVLTVLNNPDWVNPDSPTDKLYADMEKKALPALRQYYRAIDPSLRRKLKFMLSSFNSGRNAVMTIKADSTPSNEITATKYLTENYQSPLEIARKYLGGRDRDDYHKN